MASSQHHSHGPDEKEGDSPSHRSPTALLRHRSPRMKQRERSDSTNSLDRVFIAEGNPEQAPPVATVPTVTSHEKHFLEHTYDVTEMRDGFFDGFFLPPEDTDREALMQHAEQALPLAFRKKDPLSLTKFFPRQLHEARSVLRRVTTTRAGIKLLKSFLAYFIAYILCLVPAVQKSLGRYAYIMAISALFNHPGRTVGAQVDGTILTILGTATGLGWGAFGLWVSHATESARVGFGGILAAFLFVYIFVIACLRSYYVRSYQLVICAGVAISYTCLAEVSAYDVSWIKLLNYAIPWLVGQGIALFVCLVVAPDAGSRSLAVGLRQTFNAMLEGVEPVVENPLRTRRRLTQSFVGMSQTYRDLAIDFSITTLDPKDVLVLRNLIQAVIRTLLSLRHDTRIFDSRTVNDDDSSLRGQSVGREFVVNMEKAPETSVNPNEKEVLEFVVGRLANPTKTLLQSMKLALQSCDAILMEILGLRQYLGPPHDVSSDVSSALKRLQDHMTAFDGYQEEVLSSDRLPHTYSTYPEVVKIFAYCLPVQQAAHAITSLVKQVDDLQQRRSRFPRLYRPSYPLWKAIYRTNAQVRHDRGGVTAGSYFRSFGEIANIMQKIRSMDYDPTDTKCDTSQATMTADDMPDEPDTENTRHRHQVWRFLHRLQGFETRFGLKTTLVTSLLAIPAYLTGRNSWWDRYGVWWAVAMGWLMMGPRTGGNVQDLFTRAFFGVLGALWGGLSFAAGNGNPFVVAVFAAIFMIPMIYRYTQSTHPRSGMVGCVSFTVVSLAEVVAEGKPSPTQIAATRGASMVVGVIASIIVNWVLWPFVARHDLRKGMASMIFYCSVIYRRIVSKYVYYEEGHEPTKEDIEASEILEGRLRECFVRLRQLMGLTRHEIRLRAPFDPLPYSGLIDACERFFEYIVTVRQSSLMYHPHFLRDNSDEVIDLLGYRRDAIATILTNLYVLSGALRADRQVPKYLPSAPIARMRLLEKMAELEEEAAASGKYSGEQKREEMRLAQIYNFSYNESLTGCMQQLAQLEKYTKAIVGEQGFDCGFRDD